MLMCMEPHSPCSKTNEGRSAPELCLETVESRMVLDLAVAVACYGHGLALCCDLYYPLAPCHLLKPLDPCRFPSCLWRVTR